MTELSIRCKNKLHIDNQLPAKKENAAAAIVRRLLSGTSRHETTAKKRNQRRIENSLPVSKK